MKTALFLCWSLLFHTAVLAGQTIVYVSESGEKRLAIYTLDATSGELTAAGAAELPGAPGSLAMSADRRYLYAAVRSAKQFATLPVDPVTGQLGTPVLAEAGLNAAYVYPDKTGNWLLSASYSEGVVAASPIRNGVVQGPPSSVIETGKKAHSIQTDPTNRFAFVPHVGELNKVEQLVFDAATGKLKSNDPANLPGGQGEGPRHMQFHPNGRWVYFVNEQAKRVTLADFDAEHGTLKSRQSITTLPADADATKGSCADIHLSEDGRFVYASNRGHDSLALFSISAETGELTAIGHTPTEKTPRSFCLVPGGGNFIISAGEGSHRLIVFRRDVTTGSLTPLKRYDCGKGPAWVMAVQFQ
jgi:6-phosphogluconolactonase